MPACWARPTACRASLKRLTQTAVAYVPCVLRALPNTPFRWVKSTLPRSANEPKVPFPPTGAEYHGVFPLPSILRLRRPLGPTTVVSSCQCGKPTLLRLTIGLVTRFHAASTVISVLSTIYREDAPEERDVGTASSTQQGQHLSTAASAGVTSPNPVRAFFTKLFSVEDKD